MNSPLLFYATLSVEKFKPDGFQGNYLYYVGSMGLLHIVGNEIVVWH